MSPWQEVAERVFVRRYRFLDQTIGAVLGDEGVLLVDTRSSLRQADELRRDLAALTRQPATLVVNTHHHWDHAWGNARFRGLPVWAHERCGARLAALDDAAFAAEAAGIVADVAAEGDPALAAALAAEFEATRAEGIHVPDRIVATEATLDWDGRRIELRHLGLGHTDNDLVVVVPGTSPADAVLFAGDLLEAGSPPSFGDSFPLDWPGTLDRLLALAAADGTIVPGHGPVGDRAFAAGQRDEIASIGELARRVHVGELGLADAAAAGPYPGEPAVESLARALAQLRGELGPRREG